MRYCVTRVEYGEHLYPRWYPTYATCLMIKQERLERREKGEHRERPILRLNVPKLDLMAYEAGERKYLTSSASHPCFLPDHLRQRMRRRTLTKHR